MKTQTHIWRFFRAGGFDQVRLDTAADLLALPTLDQKLWLALSCPTQGVEFDAKTLALIDTDGDGHIRAPELLAAIQWASERLTDVSVFGAGLEGVPVDAIDAEKFPELAAAAKRLQQDDGKVVAGLVSVQSAADAESLFQAQAEAEWAAQERATWVLGEQTPEAHRLLLSLTEKIEDYFLRCRLVAYDPLAEAALNPDDSQYKTLSTLGMVATEPLATMPLARIEKNAQLPLLDGVNPAWSEALQKLRETVLSPVLGDVQQLSEPQWRQVKAAFSDYTAWVNGGCRQDEQSDLIQAARDLERLARYVRDLMPLANNFVAFRDFYTRQGKAIFQVGTLYLDGRSAELCVAVSDPARHLSLAALSRMCLVYCDCVRREGDGVGRKMSIAAAFTAGDADQLLVGRNGVFYDRQGRDWDATITRIVDHPISLRQAFWSPYRRLARFVAEQLQKIAANKAAAMENKMAEAATELGKKAVAPAKPGAPAQPAFDVGKFAGIFAAIGLAVGALGTATASMITGLLALKAWQIPLALAGLMLAVSGPAMIVAAFKLRSRNLGPLLDANGWAINARARINIPFGTSLTGIAQLPSGAERALTDPYADKRTPWWLYPLLLAIAAGGLYAIVHVLK